MSAVDATDLSFNTTSIPGTGIFTISPEQYHCQLTKVDVRCISSFQFSEQPFDELCPSGDCWTDCQDLFRLYSPLPSSITYANATFYGTPPRATFWGLCNGLANLTQSILDEIPSEQDAARFQSFMANNTQANIKTVAAATTQCWVDSCAQARNNADCSPKCAAVNLLQTNQIPQLAGTRECIKSVCNSIDGLPFANQDIVGIGVSISYVIQMFLIILIWTTLTIASLYRSRHRPTGSKRLSPSWGIVLDSLAGFHAAQCYFSIPLAVAVFFENPFKLDPLNAFGLLPVATNGFIPHVFTLMIMKHFEESMQELLRWYPIVLTDISYILNSILLFAVVQYLSSIKSKGVALQTSAYQSLGGIDSCGGLTAIAICLQSQLDSPPSFLLQKQETLYLAGLRLAPVVWIIATICLFIINFLQFRRSRYGSMFENASHRRNGGEKFMMPLRRMIRPFLRVFESNVVYFVASGTFVSTLFYQAVMFYSYVKLGLVDLNTWSLGQIVAITVWIPPVIDYLHLQSGAMYENLKMAKQQQDPTQDQRHSLLPRPTPYECLNSTENPASITHYTPALSQRGEVSDADGQDDDLDDMALLTHPSAFPLQQRPSGTRPES